MADQFIESLNRDLKSVRPIWRPAKLALVTFICTLTFLGLAFVWLPVGATMTAGHVWLDLVLGTFTLVVGTVAFAHLRFPERTSWEISRSMALLFALIGGLILWRIVEVSGEDRTIGLATSGLSCAKVVFEMALPFSILLGWLAMRGASGHKMISGLAVGLAGMGLGLLVITLHCPSENFTHLAVWHYLLPISVTSLLGLLFGVRFLNW